MINSLKVLLLLSLTGCALSQWAFRNANDRTVVVSTSIDKVERVFVTDRYIVLKIQQSFKPSISDSGLRLFCIDILRLNSETKELKVFINDSQFDCPEGVEAEAKKGINLKDELKVNYEKTEQLFESIRNLKVTLESAPERRKLLKGNKLYYTLVPFTFVIDLVTSPVQLGIYFYQAREQNLKRKNK